MVPKALQAAVRATYRPGQEVDKQPSVAYLKAAKSAIEAVADMERSRMLEEEAAELVEEGDTTTVLPENGSRFQVGCVVLLCPSLPGAVRSAGEVIELADRQLPEGFVAINLGILSNPYVCPESRLVNWSKAISLWRWHEGWRYAGCMSAPTRTDKPHWPNCFWFPHGYNPNTRRFEP